MKNIFISMLFLFVSSHSFALDANDVAMLTSIAEEGDATAQNALAGVYYLGEDVLLDYEQAVYWFKRSANQGHPDAQNFLGNMYLEGKGIKQDSDIAKYWYKKSAKNGMDGAAEMSLALMYSTGEYVEKNDFSAAFYYSKACDKGDDSGCWLFEKYTGVKR